MLNKVINIASYAIICAVLPGLSRQHEYHCLLPRQVTRVATSFVDNIRHSGGKCGHSWKPETEGREQ